MTASCNGQTPFQRFTLSPGEPSPGNAFFTINIPEFALFTDVIDAADQAYAFARRITLTGSLWLTRKPNLICSCASTRAFGRRVICKPTIQGAIHGKTKSSDQSSS